LNYIHLFIGSVLCATSVGITARVFKDLGNCRQRSTNHSCAAVIDDVLGLIVLAVVSGIITSAEMGQPLAIGSIARLISVAILFPRGSLVFWSFCDPSSDETASRPKDEWSYVYILLVFCFGLAYLANLSAWLQSWELSPPGLSLKKSIFKDFAKRYRLQQLIKTSLNFLVPIFFVMMGIQVRLETFANLPILGLAAGLTIAAIIGKQICGLGVLIED
jgi:Kef-type K+ transport system membrane component KefB